MDPDSHVNLRNTIAQGETSSASPFIRDPAIPLAESTRCSPDTPECEPELSHYNSQLSGSQIRLARDPPRHKQKPGSDGFESARLARSSTWSSSPTIVPLARELSRHRVLRGTMIIAEGFLQITISVVILALAASTLKSPTQPALTEWAACDYLGVYTSVWVARMCIICGLSCWGFFYNRSKIDQQHVEDLHLLTTLALTGPWSLYLRLKDHTTPELRPSPGYRFYSLALRALTGLSIIWWIGAHILEYRASSSSCRHASPHIWGLMLAILAISYIFIFSIIVVSLLSSFGNVPQASQVSPMCCLHA